MIFSSFSLFTALLCLGGEWWRKSNTMALRSLWQRITTTRYTRTLEAELAHVRAENTLLRTENRGLLNSILGIAGVPPVLVDHESVAPAQRADLAGTRRDGPADTNRAAAARLASPMRRRSWQQINRMLELESAKKKTPVAS